MNYFLPSIYVQIFVNKFMILEEFKLIIMHRRTIKEVSIIINTQRDV